MNTINFLGKEKILNTAKKEAQKVVDSSMHEYKSNSMLGVVEQEAEKLSKKTNEYVEAVRAKYAPFTMNTDKSKEAEKLTEEYKRARGNV